jgi:N-acetylglucosamine malate deacetylase 1
MGRTLNRRRQNPMLTNIRRRSFEAYFRITCKALIEFRTLRHLLIRRAQGISVNAALRRGLPAGASPILVLSPHPDDESIGCGGTLAELAALGNEIDVVYLTSGAPRGDRQSAAHREAEARAACAVLGLRHLYFLRGQDGELLSQLSLSKPIEELIAANDYRVIFCPWPGDGHADHRATFGILQDALRWSKRRPEIWLYEVWSCLAADRLVSIDSSIHLKMRAIRSHASQTKEFDLAKLALFLAKQRGKSYDSAGVRFAEGFLVCNQAGAMIKSSDELPNCTVLT